MKRQQIAEMFPIGSELILAGERVDGRVAIARRYKELVNDFAAQMGDFLSPSEQALLRRAGTLAVLCERDEARLLSGQAMDEENYRRNVTILGATLVKLGLAKKSRDVTKADVRMFDAHAASILGVDAA